MLWGLNQYGDSNQGNGVMIDFYESGTLYVRLPCGNSGNNNAVGHYRNRANDGNEVIYNQENVQFRVMVWK